MAMNRIEFIRNEEKKYHDFCYTHYSLFEEGSWLAKPVKTVMDLMEIFDGKHHIQVLDLGCGVGRNSIPTAEKLKDRHGKVVCVDFLESALEKLNVYSSNYGVHHIIHPEKADIGDYCIPKEQYDFVLAVSSLEHVESEEVFEQVLHRIASGTKLNGVTCLIINSEVQEIDRVSGEPLDALMEINLPTDYLIAKLHHVFQNWEVISELIKPLEYEITRNKKSILLKTNAITFVARKGNET